MNLNERLREYWKTQRTSPNGSLNETNLASFELKHDVVIPDDLRAYLLELNGTRDMSELDFFRFLPLGEFKTADEKPEMTFGEKFHDAFPGDSLEQECH